MSISINLMLQLGSVAFIIPIQIYTIYIHNYMNLAKISSCIDVVAYASYMSLYMNYIDYIQCHVLNMVSGLCCNLGWNSTWVYIVHWMWSIDNLPDHQHHFLANVRVSSSSLLFIDCDNNIKCLSFIQEGPFQKAPHFHSPEPVYCTAVGICFLCWWCWFCNKNWSEFTKCSPGRQCTH